MHCPNCGAQNKKKQNYCRYCGLQLADIERLYLNQLVFGADTERQKSLRSFRKVVDYAQIALIVLFVVGLLAMTFSGSGVGKGAISAGLLTFFLIQTVREIVNYSLRQSSKASVSKDVLREAGQSEFETRETNKLIEEKPFSPISSVTDESTKLLFVDRKSDKSA